MRNITTIIIGIILFFFPILFTGIERRVDKKRHLVYKVIEVEYEKLQKQEVIMDNDDIKDAIRFQWLIEQGVAWRGCYKEDWLENEWLYGHLGGREIIDEAMKKLQKL